MAEQFLKRLAPSSIIVKKRVRHDIGDLTPLMESLKQYGQLSPIIVNSKNELISGARRLTAVKRLGWPAIDALVINAILNWINCRLKWRRIYSAAILPWKRYRRLLHVWINLQNPAS